MEKSLESVSDWGELSTYPFPNSMLTLTSYLGENPGLEEG